MRFHPTKTPLFDLAIEAAGGERVIDAPDLGPILICPVKLSLPGAGIGLPLRGFVDELANDVLFRPIRFSGGLDAMRDAEPFPLPLQATGDCPVENPRQLGGEL